MEHEPIKFPCDDDDYEDGQLSDSNDGYTPLQRPNATSLPATTNCAENVSASASSTNAMEEASELDESLAELSSDTDSGSENDFPKRNKANKRKIHKIRPIHGIQIPNAQTSRLNQKKYNIWSTSLQEEVMENLKGCGVDQDNPKYNRKSESYDYSLKYRLNGENSLKRRQSYSDDSDKGYSCSSTFFQTKRFRANSLNVKDRKNVRLRLGNRVGGGGGGGAGGVDVGGGGDGSEEDSSSNDGTNAMNGPRNIIDLTCTADSENDDVARDIANKLYEEKDDLLRKIVNILGRDTPIKLFKETQKIESDGGMLIVNGMRRRTPGGVFLFLLKNCDDITKKQKKDVFLDDTRKCIKGRKAAQANKRDQKVEELKKTLQIENELPALSARGDILIGSTHLKTDHANLSNPPPSPVTDCNRENSSDFDTHDIQHVNVTSPEKDLAKASNSLTSYEDDFLTMHCDDMDLF